MIDITIIGIINCPRSYGFSGFGFFTSSIFVPISGWPSYFLMKVGVPCTSVTLEVEPVDGTRWKFIMGVPKGPDPFISPSPPCSHVKPLAWIKSTT